MGTHSGAMRLRAGRAEDRRTIAGIASTERTPPASTAGSNSWLTVSPPGWSAIATLTAGAS
ncbi:hypothetical protein [Amycolatopsis minnesotensis]|uniref:hypothetical protein n=1 Tax=Amycolatopsis minnesotensis TaxID=337894 RepID=UPI0031DC2875